MAERTLGNYYGYIFGADCDAIVKFIEGVFLTNDRGNSDVDLESLGNTVGRWNLFN